MENIQNFDSYININLVMRYAKSEGKLKESLINNESAFQVQNAACRS
jgi:hypothetical protein